LRYPRLLFLIGNCELAIQHIRDNR